MPSLVRDMELAEERWLAVALADRFVDGRLDRLMSVLPLGCCDMGGDAEGYMSPPVAGPPAPL